MEQEQKEHVTDEMCITEWRTMLNSFKEIIKDRPPINKVKGELEELMDLAKTSGRLTARQSEGIYERCQNYLNGSYGKNLSHEKTN